ncbi:penicillin-binding protein activator [Salinimonas lutimaris]|uniref:penicillin-binding protein activator n=1 Tax=Salinimonas lutimaris TaxID=914153 RepID=UPI0010C12E04|nr:penicillin-binding protein activator [Salinimonas lutimaris]
MQLAAQFIRLSKFAVIGVAVSLAACSSGPAVKRTTNAPVTSASQSMPVTQIEASPQDLLSEAQAAWQHGADPGQRDTLLLDAAAAFLQQGDISSAQQILVSLAPATLTGSLQARAHALIAQSYLNHDDIDPPALIASLHPLSEDRETRRLQLSVLAQLYPMQQQWLEAASALAQVMEPGADPVNQVWKWVNKVPDNKLAAATGSYPELEPYIALRQILQQYGLQTQSLQQELNQFTRVYRGTPLVENLPTSVQQANLLSHGQIAKAAVLLPLSGRFAASGKAIKEGILAGYYQQLSGAQGNSAKQLVFIDTNNKSASQLAEALQDFHWVVGPLLKENVEALAPLLPATTQMLALNRPEQFVQTPVSSDSDEVISPLLNVAASTIDEQPGVPTLSATTSAAWFALAPEDEAHQLADDIFAKGYRAPIVITAGSSIYQRLSDSFQLRWQQHQQDTGIAADNTLTHISFTDNNSLKDSITSALGVAQSKTRIDQIRYMVNEKLHNVTRSRHDIDAIVVFASPQETELLNPMIEASVTPFDGKTIPVYATSRSMEYDSGKNQWRDLQNVRFIDMPWMLPDNQWSTLSDEVAQIWPNRSTQQQRFFAFGVDAYHMLPHVTNMAVVPQASLSGLTGALSLNDKREVVRTLPKAIISGGRVKSTAE